MKIHELYPYLIVKDAAKAIADQNSPPATERALRQNFGKRLQLTAPRSMVEFARGERGNELDLSKCGTDRHIVAARGDAETDGGERRQEQACHPQNGMPDSRLAILKRR